MKLLHFFISLVVVTLFSCTSENEDSEINNPTPETTYFPAINSDVWETTTPTDLNWNTNALNELALFLEASNTKSFIILYKGKIAFEQYFNGHSESDSWYWASAGKTLTTAVTGIAQDQGLLDIDNKVSDYLGTGWTSATLDQENLITCKNLLSMNSGLDDTTGDSVAPENLQYIADAGTRWAYHNVYVKLQDVVAQASNKTWTNYFNENLRDLIGMSGTWLQIGDLSVYWSNSRSMARFGLLISEGGLWENTQIISQNYIDEATNTSQSINDAYGYMWWLNGKSSFHLPQTQFEFSGSLIPNGPNDMYCALGKNDQKIYIVPSKDLVIIRMGDAADEDSFGLSSYDNALWEKLNAVLD